MIPVGVIQLVLQEETGGKVQFLQCEAELLLSRLDENYEIS